MPTSRRSFLKRLPQSSLTLPLAGGPDRRPVRDALASLPAPSDPEYWERVRDLFLLARDRAYFNAGTVGATPRPVLEAVVEELRRAAADVADWDFRGDDRIAGYQPMLPLRGRIGSLFGADPGEIVLTENATAGMNLVAGGLDLRAGDEILMSDQEHVGARCPWELKARTAGLLVRQVAVPRPAPDAAAIRDGFLRALTPRTRVLVLQHVMTYSGAVVPVGEICAAVRGRDVVTVVDGAHAVGQIPVDLHALGCDAYAACFHKWLLAPAGTGFLYVRKDRIGALRSTYASEQWDNRDDDGFRLGQRGTGSLALLAGIDAALGLHEALGPADVYARIKALGERLRAGLAAVPGVSFSSPADPAVRAGITVWSLAGRAGDSIQDELWARGRLRVRASARDFPGVRQCTHVFNLPAEIDRTVELAGELAAA